jgi:predicted enzyme related to lactoylglutathione lyase
MIKGIHSTFIWTEDLPRLLGFYRDTLGLEVDEEIEGFVMFKATSGAPLGIGIHSEVKGNSNEPRVMVNFVVDDCRAEHERLAGRGVKFILDPEVDPNDGFTLATFLDPDGNTLQLVQPPA